MSFDGLLGKKKWAGLLLQRLKIDLDVILSLGGGKIPAESQPTNQPTRTTFHQKLLTLCLLKVWLGVNQTLPPSRTFIQCERKSYL